MQKIARSNESSFLDSIVEASSNEILIQKSRKPGYFVVTVPTTDGKTQDLSGDVTGILDMAGDLAVEHVLSNDIVEKLMKLLEKQ
jgi:hypothetical protein